MNDQLTITQARGILESAFLPCECVTESQDYEHRVGFRVYSEDREDLMTRELLRSSYRSPIELESVINGTRDYLAGRGIVLDHWAMPKI